MDINIGIVKRQYIRKYIMVIECLSITRGLTIHPMWVIDEYAIIDLSLV
jgi:hypothetical protein